MAAFTMLVGLAPAEAREKPSLAFRIPSEIAYCGFVTSGWECFSPRTGAWVRMTGIYGRSIGLRRGTDRDLIGFRDPRVPVLRVGVKWASSDAEAIRCFAARLSVRCIHHTGLTVTMSRTGPKTFLGRPGFRPNVSPLFRVGWGAYCGIDADNLEPSIPILVCWNAANGTTVTVGHGDQFSVGTFARRERARGYRPRGFPTLSAGQVHEWRCHKVGRSYADRCTDTGGRIVFRCSAYTGVLRCVNARRHGFAVARDGSFDVF